MERLCYDCVIERHGKQAEDIGGNDLERQVPKEPEYKSALCTGCGFHYFDRYGTRACDDPGERKLEDELAGFCTDCIATVEGVPDVALV